MFVVLDVNNDDKQEVEIEEVFHLIVVVVRNIIMFVTILFDGLLFIRFSIMARQVSPRAILLALLMMVLLILVDIVLLLLTATVVSRFIMVV